jgi:hypothetical protein
MFKTRNLSPIEKVLSSYDGQMVVKLTDGEEFTLTGLEHILPEETIGKTLLEVGSLKVQRDLAVTV